MCTCNLLDCIPRENDRICIYAVGWLDVKKYEIMEWVPVNNNAQICTVVFNRKLIVTLTVRLYWLYVDSGPSLPNNKTETYQFCYISAENEVYGASSPFQFAANIQESFYPSIKHFITGDLYVKNASRMKSNRTIVEEKDKEIYELKKEVALLKKTLTALVMKDSIYKEVEDQKYSIQLLKSALVLQQNEINGLKNQISKNSQNKLENNKAEDMCNIEEQNLFDVGDLKELPPFPIQDLLEK